jgi:hypothetical protein
LESMTCLITGHGEVHIDCLATERNACWAIRASLAARRMRITFIPLEPESSDPCMRFSFSTPTFTKLYMRMSRR